MEQYCLKIRSKNEKSLKNFSYFFFKHLNTKFSTIQKLSTNQTSRKILTFLKSPHVNKTAQEHFESHIFTKNVLVVGFSLEKNLIFLKKVLTKLFQDISVQLVCQTCEKTNRKNSLSIFNFNNFRLSKKKFYKTNSRRCKQKITLKVFNATKSSLFNLLKHLNNLSIFGEMLIISFLKNNL